MPLIVNFSGGKDSLVCLFLARGLTKNIECLFMASGLELPGTLEYVRERCREFDTPLNVSHPEIHRIQHRIIPKYCHNLPGYIRHWGYFPTAVKRYCSCWLKHRPGRLLCREKWGRETVFKIVGIRLNESNVRKWKYGNPERCRKYGGREIRPDAEHNGSFMVMPILDWTNEQIAAFLKEKNVEIHSGYKHFGTSGCKWCPVMKPETAYLIAQKFPGIYSELVAAENDIQKPAWQHKKIWLKDIVAMAANKNIAK